MSENGTSTFASSHRLLRGGCVEAQVIISHFQKYRLGFSASLGESIRLGGGRLLEIHDLWTHMT